MYKPSSKIMVRHILESAGGEFVSQGELIIDARIIYGYGGDRALLLKRAEELVNEGVAVSAERGMAQLKEYALKVNSLEGATTR
jgi:hypothetical protein